MDETSQMVSTLATGTEFEIKRVQRKGGADWVQIALPNGTTGFMKGDTRVFTIKKVALVDKQAEVRDGCSSGAPVTRHLTKGQTFELMEVVEGDGKEWVRIRDGQGGGFIAADVKIQDVSAPVVGAGGGGDGGKDMLVGALWCIGGIVVTALTYSAASEGGGTYVVAWGAILFGGIQFLRGLFRSVSNG